MNDFFFMNGVWYKLFQDHEILVVPKAIHNQIIQDARSKGHFSTQKTVEPIERDYYVANLHKLVQTDIANCVPCILSSKKSGNLKGFLYPIPKGYTPLNTQDIDFFRITTFDKQKL